MIYKSLSALCRHNSYHIIKYYKTTSCPWPEAEKGLNWGRQEVAVSEWVKMTALWEYLFNSSRSHYTKYQVNFIYWTRGGNCLTLHCQHSQWESVEMMRQWISNHNHDCMCIWMYLVLKPEWLEHFPESLHQGHTGVRFGDFNDV
jgi:hypothetical protein